MKLKRTMACIMGVLCLTGCTGITPETIVQDTMDFTSYRTNVQESSVGRSEGGNKDDL